MSEFLLTSSILDAVCYTLPMATTSYLDRMLDPVFQSFTPSLARRIIDLRVDDKVEQRVTELRRKANDGTLTPEASPVVEDIPFGEAGPTALPGAAPGQPASSRPASLQSGKKPAGKD